MNKTEQQKIELVFGELVKEEDLRFNGKHPNDINTGYIFRGMAPKIPTVGERFDIVTAGRYLSTSKVVKVLDWSDKYVTFETENSKYKFTYLEA